MQPDVTQTKLQAILQKQKNQQSLTDSEAVVLVGYYNKQLEKNIPVQPGCAQEMKLKKIKKRKRLCSIQ